MPHFPLFLSLIFGLTTALAGWLFCRATHRPAPVLRLLLGWLLVQGAVTLTGFYTVAGTLPPRPALLIGPPVLLIGALFATAAGRRFLAGLRPDALTLLHVVRLPVELVLLGLYWYGGVPRLMTFEGRNWDILMGLTAPLVYYLGFRRPRWGRSALLAWNLLGLGLLLNIMVNALLAVPSPWQRWGFEQPNVAVLQFPFVWLPSVVVPLVLLAHLAAIWQLLARSSSYPAASAAGSEQPGTDQPATA
ncbi:hypothetical protein [Hymenobacter gummosus]|uniref:hypothetical protein n=1 Tax=Hymenobacter gummosus TaxID=1776032 RepID=UPI001A9DE204|nr:hypothetical protein [Hymenobacter gummosus]